MNVTEAGFLEILSYISYIGDKKALLILVQLIQQWMCKKITSLVIQAQSLTIISHPYRDTLKRFWS